MLLLWKSRNLFNLQYYLYNDEHLLPVRFAVSLSRWVRAELAWSSWPPWGLTLCQQPHCWQHWTDCACYDIVVREKTEFEISKVTERERERERVSEGERDYLRILSNKGIPPNSLTSSCTSLLLLVRWSSRPMERVKRCRSSEWSSLEQRKGERGRESIEAVNHRSISGKLSK